MLLQTILGLKFKQNFPGIHPILARWGYIGQFYTSGILFLNKLYIYIFCNIKRWFSSMNNDFFLFFYFWWTVIRVRAPNISLCFFTFVVHRFECMLRRVVEFQVILGSCVSLAFQTIFQNLLKIRWLYIEENIHKVIWSHMFNY